MDKLYFQRMSFYGYHGVFDAEAQLGQRFYVDLEISLDMSKAAESDNLQDTLDYGEIFKSVQTIVETERFKLIEALAARIANQLLDTFPLFEVTVKVTKPNPPINGHYDAVAVEMTRMRQKG